MLANAENLLELTKKHGSWKSSTVVESYLEESMRLAISNQILRKDPTEYKI